MDVKKILVKVKAYFETHVLHIKAIISYAIATKSPKLLIRYAQNLNGATLIDKVIAIGVGFLVIASFLPTSFETMISVNTSNWTAVMIALWNNLPVFGMLGIGIAVIYTVLRN